jgi:hypothetical protein
LKPRKGLDFDLIPIQCRSRFADEIDGVDHTEARERSSFELTLKGTEELAMRTYRLDVKARNILFLIQRGYPTIDGILGNSIFPCEEVIERLRELLRGRFVTRHAPEDSLAAPTTITRPADPAPDAPAAPTAQPQGEQPQEPVDVGP